MVGRQILMVAAMEVEIPMEEVTAEVIRMAAEAMEVATRMEEVTVEVIRTAVVMATLQVVAPAGILMSLTVFWRISPVLP